MDKESHATTVQISQQFKQNVDLDGPRSGEDSAEESVSRF